MIFDLRIRRWHNQIIRDAQKTLGRPLRDCEKLFITSRTGGIALEMIHDTVKAATREELEAYLGAERESRPASEKSAHDLPGAL